MQTLTFQPKRPSGRPGWKRGSLPHSLARHMNAEVWVHPRTRIQVISTIEGANYHLSISKNLHSNPVACLMSEALWALEQFDAANATEKWAGRARHFTLPLHEGQVH